MKLASIVYFGVKLVNPYAALPQLCINVLDSLSEANKMVILTTHKLIPFGKIFKFSSYLYISYLAKFVGVCFLPPVRVSAVPGNYRIPPGFHS